jgi:ABC-type nitrate/sulfonate/bicarbonate transport system substrate-binding protein
MLKVADPVTLTCWIANGEWARANRDAVQRWVSSLEDAKSFINDHDEEAREILAKWTRLPDDVIKNIVLPTYNTSLAAGDVSVWIEATREAGQLTRSLNASDLVLN